MATPQHQWKAAASLHLLLDSEHPPARVEKSAQDVKTRAALTPIVDARNTVDFRTTSYCGLQTVNSKRCLKALCEYYRRQLQRIPIWQAYEPAGASGMKGESNRSAAEVKNEPKEDDDGNGDNGEFGGDGSGRVSGNWRSGAAVFRAVGILTHASEPSVLDNTPRAPWELHVISDLNDDSAYLAAFRALQQNAAAAAAKSTIAQAAKPGVKRERAADRSVANDDDEMAPDPLQDDEERLNRDLDDSRLSLYPHFAEPFTGVVPGMAIGVIGEPFMRSTRGVLTGVQVRRLVLPTRPQFPWRIDYPLPSVHPPGSTGSTSAARSLRVHFCSGPYPRHELTELLRTVTTQALHRGADLLIVGGPLVPPFGQHERDIVPTLKHTFAEQLESLLDLFEDTMGQYYANRPLATRMKVLLVSHREDVTQVPVLPTTMYAIADSDAVLVRSNPCRISIDGVHIGINNEDVLTDMRRAMLERWPSADGSLRRVVEAMVHSRLYTPILKLPQTKVDLHHLHQLFLETLPGGSDEDAAATTIDRHRRWEAIFQPTKSEPLSPEEARTLKNEPKRVKREEAEDDGTRRESHGVNQGTVAQAVVQRPASVFDVQETMPHIIFSPSQLPPFAHVTHRAVPDPSGALGRGVPVDESPIDDVAAATGVLVVNQGTWSRRVGGRYELRVAEVTIKDTTTVVYRGASVANSVACGVLHVFKDTTQ